MSGLELVAGGLSALGAGTSAFGTIMEADSQASALNAGRFNHLLAGVYRSQALQQAANEQRAAGQRSAFEVGREKDLLLSRSRALAAASGGGAQDTSVINTQAAIEAQGEFQKALTMFGPEMAARELETASQNALIGALNQDAATGYQAAQIRRRGKLELAGTILSDTSTGLKKYRRYLPFGPSEDEVAIAEAYRDAAKVRADYSAWRLRGGRPW